MPRIGVMARGRLECHVTHNWWACSDLNREPRHYECHALTIELQAQPKQSCRIIVLASFRTSTFSRRLRVCLIGTIREVGSQLKERNLGASRAKRRHRRNPSVPLFGLIRVRDSFRYRL